MIKNYIVFVVIVMGVVGIKRVSSVGLVLMLEKMPAFVVPDVSSKSSSRLTAPPAPEGDEGSFAGRLVDRLIISSSALVRLIISLRWLKAMFIRVSKLLELMRFSIWVSSDSLGALRMLLLLLSFDLLWVKSIVLISSDMQVRGFRALEVVCVPACGLV
jgi:hypothetical protein